MALTYERLNELIGDTVLVFRPEREIIGMLLVELKDLLAEVQNLRQEVERLKTRRRKPAR